MKVCSIEGCKEKHEAKGYCAKHYQRFKKHGDPLKEVARPLEEKFWEKVDKSGECWVWTAATCPAGYGVININHKTFRTHRLSWEMYHGKQLGKLHILHTCDNPPCVNPQHLTAGTHTDNMRDMFKKGRKVVGELHPMSTVTHEQVKQVKQLRESGYMYKEISGLTGISTQTITNIIACNYYPTANYEESKIHSLTSWLNRAIESSFESSSFNKKVGIFKKMWVKEFGSLDSVPDVLKSRADEKFEELKKMCAIKSRRRGSIWNYCLDRKAPEK